MKLYPITKAKLWLRCLIAGERCIACGEMNTRGRGLMCSACEDELKRALQEYKGAILLICHEPEFYLDVVSEVWDCSKWTTKLI